MATRARRTKRIPIPSLIESEEGSESLLATWDVIHEAALRCRDLVRTANNHERDALRTITNALGALSVVIGRGDDEELGKLRNWAKQLETRMLESATPIPTLDRFEMAAACDVTRLPLAPTPPQLARAIRRRWRSSTKAALLWSAVDMTSVSGARPGEILEVEMRVGSGFPIWQQYRNKRETLGPPGTDALRGVVSQAEGSVVLFGAPPTREAVAKRVPATADIAINVRRLVRFEVARGLARALQSLTEKWFKPGDEPRLAEEIYRTMPWSAPRRDHPSGRSWTDKNGVARAEIFAEDHEATIRAAFRAAGCDETTANNLFKAKAQ